MRRWASTTGLLVAQGHSVPPGTERGSQRPVAAAARHLEGDGDMSGRRSFMTAEQRAKAVAEMAEMEEEAREAS